MAEDNAIIAEAKKAPVCSMYTLSLGTVPVKQVLYEMDVIPGNVLLDIFIKVAEDGSYEDAMLVKEKSSDLSVFLKLMNANSHRNKLHKFFKSIINKEIETAVNTEAFIDRPINPILQENEDLNSYRHLVMDLLPARLASNFEIKAMKEINSQDDHCNLIKIGMPLGEFLCEAGWYEEGAKVLNQCMYICMAEDNLEGYKRSVKCMERLLMAQVAYSLHSQARMTFETANFILKKLKDANIDINLAGIYSAFSGLSYLECDYKNALVWSIKALEELNRKDLKPVDPRTTIDILRQAAKACIVKREFHKAELLIQEAVYLARDIYGSKSVKYADALLDYGYYKVNRDSVQQGVEVYRECLEIRKAAFGTYNLMTAIVIEDLSYALYVQEYSSGNFTEARSLAQDAVSIMAVLLQKNHLQFASVKRVKALILEEIAIDNHGVHLEVELLREAEKLHLHALNLSKQVFGEMNVQIAKHYGNLGRLYQSMRKYSEAEEMHLKAIAIKEALLGLYDYEVALSVGHLASLYNYDMEQYRKAEELHLRAIQIGKKLFGNAYSGLEYDYRGLLQIYSLEGNIPKFEEYSRIFSEWRMLRDLRAANCNSKAVLDSKSSQPLSIVIEDFFTMKWINVED